MDEPEREEREADSEVRLDEVHGTHNPFDEFRIISHYLTRL
jgi:hypothetical protein